MKLGLEATLFLILVLKNKNKRFYAEKKKIF